MNAQQMISSMIELEYKNLEPDERRVIRDARMRLHAAVQTKNGTRIVKAMLNAQAHVEGWQHRILKHRISYRGRAVPNGWPGIPPQKNRIW